MLLSYEKMSCSFNILSACSTIHVPKLRVIKVTLNWRFFSNPFYKLKIEGNILKDTNCN